MSNQTPTLLSQTTIWTTEAWQAARVLVDDRLWATVVRLCNADTEAHTPYWWATLLLKVDSDGLELESDFEYETHHVHRYPDDWNYSYDPAGSKMCLFPGCDYTIYD